LASLPVVHRISPLNDHQQLFPVQSIIFIVWGELAHHFGSSDKVRKAVEYLWCSAQQAADRSAYSEAIASISRGLEVLQKLPDYFDDGVSLNCHRCGS
jgi:hypothetical protein